MSDIDTLAKLLHETNAKLAAAEREARTVKESLTVAERERDALRETLQHIGTGAGRAVRLAMNGTPPQDKKEKK